MIFNSFNFVIFFIVFQTLALLTPPQRRWPIILIASMFFYACYIPKYLILMGAQIVTNFILAILIERSTRQKKLLLLLALLSNLGILGFFKYYNFAVDNINTLSQLSIRHLEILLPLGISFHTFQVLAYIIEVYRGRFPAEKHLGIFSIYILFYPQLVAGPIERPAHLLPQIKKPASIDFAMLRSGLELMLFGFFKKCVIADNAAKLVDQVFSSPQDYGGRTLLIASYFFAIQIYCDFSGYVDIARGASRCLGIELSQNFRSPYFSKSIAEFWQRWHITLSTWFRDYLFQPLMTLTESVSLAKLCFVTIVVFFFSGLWHGAAWHYVVFGLFHGAGIAIGLAWQSRVKLGRRIKKMGFWYPVYQGLQILVTFHLLLIGWVFFRAKSLTDAFFILHKFTFSSDFVPTKTMPLDHFDLGLPVIAFCLLLVGEWLYEVRPDIQIDRNLPALRWALFCFACIFILMAGRFDATEFVYFKF